MTGRGASACRGGRYSTGCICQPHLIPPKMLTISLPAASFILVSCTRNVADEHGGVDLRGEADGLEDAGDIQPHAAGGLGWAVSGWVLRPLRAITEAARTAARENLDQRLALAGPPDELKELADTFDAMLTRLDAAFASQRRFVANASHELRTPLTEMRTLIDVSLAKPAGSARQLEPVLAGVRAAVDKSEELIEALLTLARNLVDNAVRHNVPDGWVLASTRHDAGQVELTVANGGEPIPADQVSGLFEPFRRLFGRTGSRSGTGLGLSIVASVARAYDGLAEARQA